MRKLIVKEWITLDGIFDGDTMDEWFHPFQSDEKIEYIQNMVQASDAMLYGRTTYEMLAPYWSKFKHNEMGIAEKLNSVPKFVVSSSLKSADWNNSTIIRNNVVEEISRLKNQPGQQILIDGSATLVQSLMGTALIDEYQFLVHPIMVGKGRRFFRDSMHTPALKLVKTKTFPLGVMLVCYQPAKLLSFPNIDIHPCFFHSNLFILGSKQPLSLNEIPVLS